MLESKVKLNTSLRLEYKLESGVEIIHTDHDKIEQVLFTGTITHAYFFLMGLESYTRMLRL